MSLLKDDHQIRRHRFKRLFGLGGALGFMVFLVSCTQFLEEVKETRVRLNEKNCRKCEYERVAIEILGQARLQSALRLIQEGKNQEARAILEEMLQEQDTFGMNSPGASYLSIVELLEKDELSRLQASKRYFEAASRSFPEGPAQENAQRIVELLEKQIAQANKDKNRVKELNHLVQEKDEEIQNLKYKLEQLEEIQQDIDRKRESLDLK